MPTKRRTFLQQVAVAAAAAQTHPDPAPRAPAPDLPFPRIFSGRQLTGIAFPLGGVCAGSISLGGRGQLRDWEIFNRPDKGNSPSYAFPAIWAQAEGRPAVARVLESRIQPPYGGSSGLGTSNAPGLVRLASATFTGEFPLAHIDFADAELPVRVSLDAFSPFIPHEPDDSGLPVAVLRYRVHNPQARAAKVSIAWSIDNPTGRTPSADPRVNEHRASGNLEGLYMTSPDLPETDALRGSFAVAILDPGDAQVTWLRGWQRDRWWNSPMLYWDDFSADGALGPEPAVRNAVGALCVARTIPAGRHVEYTFLLAWHFPNRTPRRCGWNATKGQEDTLIGNWYCTRFADAWAAAEYAAGHLPALEAKTRRFAAALRESTIPGAVKDAASANLSTLVTQVCFRTADGEFHGFEGANDHAGCCHGSCAHVWNYETTTPHLFPTFARSLRATSFGYDLDSAGALHFRENLPHGQPLWGYAAADGQMGQILHAYLDWRLSGDLDWLHRLWPNIQRALEFAWIPGGWDADRDGVMEGVQHNTYDVEFYGPNPLCGIFYLGALRAAEEMARAVGDASADEYRRLFQNGSRWIDANLFNGEYYIQQVRGVPKDRIAASLRSGMGSDDTVDPQYQVGKGCLADQLIGQYLAEVAGLGPLLSPANLRKTLASVYRYNFRSSLAHHQSVERTYALNDEAAVVICDYGRAPRPRIPFPYYAEAGWTGIEYLVASHMLFAGMIREGLEVYRAARLRFDGEKRNPWDEPECGHHYARAMSAWSGVVAMSGFRYHGGEQKVEIHAPTGHRCFWATATGWGTFRITAADASLHVDHGSLAVQVSEVNGRKAAPGKVVHEGEDVIL